MLGLRVRSSKYQASIWWLIFPFYFFLSLFAAFTTTHASLKLYSVLEQLNRRVLYFDKDSVIYVSREGNWEQPTGLYLGDLTDELDGNYITTFVSGGPKNYSNKLNMGKTVWKIRGITLNYKTQQEVSFDVMQNMVRDIGPETISVYIHFKIARDRNNKSV